MLVFRTIPPKILRVLKPGGIMIIIAESYRGGKHDFMHATKCYQSPHPTCYCARSS